MNTRKDNIMSEIPLKILFRRRELLRQLAALAFGGGAAGYAADPLIPRFGITFSGARNCLPRHDYQHQAKSPTLIVQSLPFQKIDSIANDLRIAYAASSKSLPAGYPVPVRKRLRPNRAMLQIDHCRISDVVLEIENSGVWIMSLAAHQNPPLMPEESDTFRERIHLRRNSFQFEARLLTSEASTFADPVESDVQTLEPRAGRLVVARIRPRDFWVQREQPRTLRWSGYCRDVCDSFDEIRSAEFEFRYKLDPLSAAGENVRRLNER